MTRENDTVRFLSSLVAALKVFKRNPAKTLNVTRLWTYLNKTLGTAVTEGEMEDMLSIVLNLESAIREYFEEYTFRLRKEKGVMRLSLDKTAPPADPLKESEKGINDSEKKKGPRLLNIARSDVQLLSDVFELYALRQFKGFDLEEPVLSDKAVRSLRKLKGRYPAFFNEHGGLLYISAVYFDFIKEYSRYQKLRRPVSHFILRDHEIVIEK